jgi:hypothetical protein
VRSYYTYPNNEPERLDFIRRSVEARNPQLEIYANYAFDHLRETLSQIQEAHNLLHKDMLLTKGKLFMVDVSGCYDERTVIQSMSSLLLQFDHML